MQWVLLLSVSVWFGGADASPKDAVKQVFRKYDYQRTLVAPGSGEAGSGPWSRETWREQLKRQDPRYQRPGGRAVPKSREPGSPPIEPGNSGSLAILEILVWVALGVALATGLTSLARSWGPRKRTARRAVSERVATSAAALQRPRTAAEALADEGRYAEAVHVLLLDTIAALAAVEAAGLPAALTSREILSSTGMPAAARGPFGGLVHEVEHSLFGGSPVTEAVWNGCLARFQAFEAAYRSAKA